MNTPTTPSTPVLPGQSCPCGSGKNYGQCCQQVIAGTQPAASAEALMRARFSAHVVHDYKFLHYSDHSNAGHAYVEDTGAPSMVWTKLVIHAHETGADANVAYVDFSAYGMDQGQEQVLHEKSEFRRINGAWIYWKALRLGPAPFKSATPKVGRNDPCPCGSGKKYKHCCGK